MNAYEGGVVQDLQSRWKTQRFGALGSMLGDKAAEVTALAQQSLGDSSASLGLHSAFTSAFSHLPLGAQSAGGLLSSFRGFKGTPGSTTTAPPP